MQEPHLPKKIDLEAPLLGILLHLGGSVEFFTRGREIEVMLATEVGLSDEARDFFAPNYNAQGNRKWRNHIQFVRDQLVKKGCIDRSRRGYWTVTERGKQLARLPKTISADLFRESQAMITGDNIADYISSPEGRKSIIESIRYERSKTNRDLALRYHGNSCIVCGFSFDAFYGTGLAEGFIEVHHTKPVSLLDGATVNIKEDLVPVCANCHRMLHRRAGEPVSIHDLRQIVEQGVALKHE